MQLLIPHRRALLSPLLLSLYLIDDLQYLFILLPVDRERCDYRQSAQLFLAERDGICCRWFSYGHRRTSHNGKSVISGQNFTQFV